MDRDEIIGHVKGIDIYENVKFGADPNKNLNLMNLHLVS